MFLNVVLAFWLPFFSSPSKEFSIGPEPAWVAPCVVDLNPTVKSSQIHFQPLLFDYQDNVEEKTKYSHKITKILTLTGAQSITQLSITFAPADESLVFHSLRIWREGKCLDLLSQLTPKLIQPEKRLAENIYDGTKMLVYFLEDVRAGDVLEYAYSIIGWRHSSSKYFDIVSMQQSVEMEKFFFRLLAHPDRQLRFKSFHLALEPQIRDISSRLREWTWETTQIEALKVEKAIPAWYIPGPYIHISEFQSWGEVAKTLFDYSPPPYFTPSEEMVEMIHRWKGQTADPLQRAELAIRFVQDEIKYLGFEEGEKAYVADDPGDVLTRRYGDCKNKTFLLKTFLNLMDIEADAVLVNSKMGRGLTEMLPSLGRFDHVVLRFSIEGNDYFVDPTIKGQKGPIQYNYFPDYYYGLIPGSETTDLIPLPKSLQHPSELYVDIRLTSPTEAQLTAKASYYGNEANVLRKLIATVGLDQFAKARLKTIKEQYRKVKEISPAKIVDDLQNNTLTVEQYYQIATRAMPGKRFLKLVSTIHETALSDDVDSDRKAPYSLSYPLWIKEKIHVENPFSHWAIEEDTFDAELTSIQYHFSMKREAQVADYTYELKHLDDNVPVSEIEAYRDFIDAVTSHSSQELYIAPAGKPPQNS